MKDAEEVAPLIECAKKGGVKAVPRNGGHRYIQPSKLYTVKKEGQLRAIPCPGEVDVNSSSPLFHARTWTFNNYSNTRFPDFGTEQKNEKRMPNTAVVPSSKSVK